MNTAKRANSHVYTRCLYRKSPLSALFLENGHSSRKFAQSAHLPQKISKDDEDPKSVFEPNGESQAEGRMSERLAQMTDEMIEGDVRSTEKAIEEGGFSEELKKKLEARLQESSFRSQNATAFAQANIPVCSTCMFIS